MNRQRQTIGLIAMMMLCTFSMVAQTKLRYNLKTGQKYGLNQLSEQEIKQDIMGMSQVIKNTIGGEIFVTITDKKADVYSSDITFSALRFKMESPMFSVDYNSKDSNADLTNPIAKALGFMVGKVFAMKFNDRGEVLEVTGFQAMMDDLAKSYADDPSTLGQMKQTLAQQFDDESLAKSIGMMLVVYPEDKIKAGASWTHTNQSLKPLPLTSNNEYAFDGKTGDVIELTGTGSSATGENASMKQGGMTQHLDLKGGMKYTAKIDANTGWPKEVTQEQILEGTVAVESPQMPAPMEIPMSIKSVTKYTAL
ncbi:MAG: hypothetical protein JEZ14_02385 [Marinilabiliaceae bacterium]|nr:hypothetical protein [Marinilabiliaceae bacterium]